MEDPLESLKLSHVLAANGYCPNMAWWNEDKVDQNVSNNGDFSMQSDDDEFSSSELSPAKPHRSHQSEGSETHVSNSPQFPRSRLVSPQKMTVVGKRNRRIRTPPSSPQIDHPRNTPSPCAEVSQVVIPAPQPISSTFHNHSDASNSTSIELAKTIDVGEKETKSLEIKGGLDKHISGSTNFQCDVVDPLGFSGGIASLWDPTIFSASDSIKASGFLVFRGLWLRLRKKCCFVNVYAPQDPSGKSLFVGNQDRRSSFHLYELEGGNGWAFSDNMGMCSGISPLSLVAGKLKNLKEHIKKWRKEIIEANKKEMADLTNNINSINLLASVDEDLLKNCYHT
ncbi:unnamed protein product [Lactuca virosa]|uniref:Uncharacterized protein n=1 Tax=Lactuca virosa TaxID=75947 RepID=A0AAU9MN98_9ASTR|nr:unnamed protein product [Lactuca virosa]